MFCNLIPEGTKVRYLLDYPIDYLTKKKIGSKFRETDIRWSLGDHVVTRILLKPNQPPMYIIDSNPNVAYTKDQLQIVQPNEVLPDKKMSYFYCSLYMLQFSNSLIYYHTDFD